MREYPNILTIAGTDPGGGAGIQADIKTSTALGGFSLSVITALVAQNGLGVKGILPVLPDFVLLQLNTVLEGFTVHAAKTGMLCNAQIMTALAPWLEKRDYPLVVDPVCVSQSGHRLVEESAVKVLHNSILPLADIITPNIPEAETLSGIKIKSMGDLERSAKALLHNGSGAVLIKGGHLRSGDLGLNPDTLTDWLFFKDGSCIAMEHEKIETGNNHGTGCTLSSAIATYLGRGLELEQAVRKAQDFLLRALKESFNPGKGAGPVNFMAGAGWM